MTRLASKLAKNAHYVLALGTLIALSQACGDDVEIGVYGGASSRSPDGGPCEVTSCQGHIYQCGDCLDNDGDGMIDARDPECLGPCDNTEDSYYGGIPGQNNAPCVQDCYFDQDTGAGNDNCYYSHECDPLSNGAGTGPSGDERCTFNPDAVIPGTSATCAELETSQPPECAAICGPLTPNGCDCFGCCELPAKSGHFVWLGSTNGGIGSCSIATLADPQSCRPCTPVASCFNGCSDCELCIGRDALGPTCTPSDGGTNSAQCPADREPCGLRGQDACPSGKYCVTGCCVAVPR